MNGVGPQDRQALFQSIESEIESMPEMFVVICEFVDELQDSEVSEASIALFLTELKKNWTFLKRCYCNYCNSSWNNARFEQCSSQ